MKEVGNRDLDNYTDQWRHGELCGTMDRILSELKRHTTLLEQLPTKPPVPLSEQPPFSYGPSVDPQPPYSLTAYEKIMSRKDWA